MHQDIPDDERGEDDERRDHPTAGGQGAHRVAAPGDPPGREPREQEPDDQEGGLEGQQARERGERAEAEAEGRRRRQAAQAGDERP